jgi:hypothetical protein
LKVTDTAFGRSLGAIAGALLDDVECLLAEVAGLCTLAGTSRKSER